MALFRKNSAAATSADQAEVDADASGKGRATPSRKQAEAERKERLKATARGENKTKGRGSAAPKAASASREDRKTMRQRALAGDERALPARDRGPERRYARDLIDSRRTVGEYFLYAAFAILFLGFIRTAFTQLLSQALLLTIIVLLAGDSYRIYKSVDRAVHAKFPTGDVTGVARYATMRAISLRRMRIPKPQVSPPPLGRKKR